MKPNKNERFLCILSLQQSDVEEVGLWRKGVIVELKWKCLGAGQSPDCLTVLWVVDGGQQSID